jgi:hypothetical protein
VKECVNDCGVGFFGNPKAMPPQCKTCPDGCVDCNADGCFDCLEGYEKNYLDECVACPDDCTMCYDGDCFLCDTDFFIKMEGALAGSCVDSTGCGDGNFADTRSGMCMPCPEECPTCNTFEQCTDCVSGFVLNTGVCVGCGDGCEQCGEESC